MFNLSSKQHSLSCQIFLSKSLINCLHLRNINLCFYLSPLKPFPITIYLFFYISLFSKHELSFKTILSIFVNIKHRYRNCWWLDSNPGHLASEATEPQPLSYSYSDKIIIMFFTSSTFLLYLCYLLSLHPTWQPDHPETTKSKREREREREGGREIESEKIILYWIRSGTMRVVWKLSETLPKVIYAIYLNEFVDNSAQK